MVEVTPKAQSVGFADSIQAAFRYITVIVTAFIAIIGLLKTKDIAGLIAYVQSNGGGIFTAISGLIAIATAAYGIFKTHRRGVQAATPAVLPKV